MTKHSEKTETSNSTKPVLDEVYCKVFWYTGDITIEKILSEDNKFYYFDYNKNHSYLSEKENCILL